MRNVVLSALAAAFVAVSAPGDAGTLPGDVDPALLDGEKALQRVRAFTAIGPRVSGTEGASKAAEYLKSELETMGIEAIVDEFTENTPAGDKTFRNVTATIRGQSPGLIIVGSHYDTKSGMGPEFVGANDSGSSTGLLLELAALFAGAQNRGPDIMVAFFDGEECVRRYGRSDGLHGSRRLARKLADGGRKDDVVAVVILDMIGDSNLNVQIPRNSSPALISDTFEAARAAGHRSQFSLGKGDVIDDHQPFLEAGMPAIDLIDFEFGSKPGLNDYWHTEEDTVDKLSAASLQTVGRVTIHLVNILAKKKGRR